MMSLICLFISSSIHRRLSPVYNRVMDTKKRVHLPALKVAESISGEWPKVTVRNLESSLVAKLPFVLLKTQSKKSSMLSKSKPEEEGTITVFKEVPITPLTSAFGARVPKKTLQPISDFVQTPKLPRGVAKKYSPQNCEADLIEIVDDYGGHREICPRPAEVTSPYHITIPTKQVLLDDQSEYRITGGYKKQEEDPTHFDTTTSYYQYPTATNPFCIGNSSESTKAWRQSQKQVFLWESTYSASRIHDNFVHDKLEKYLGKSLKDFEKNNPSNPGYKKQKQNIPKLDKSPSSTYHYPERFLPSESKIPSTSTVGGGELHTIIDFLHSVSDMQHVGKETLRRLKTAVDRDVEKTQRYQRKRKVQTRDYAASLIRRMYQLSL